MTVTPPPNPPMVPPTICGNGKGVCSVVCPSAENESQKNILIVEC